MNKGQRNRQWPKWYSPSPGCSKDSGGSLVINVKFLAEKIGMNPTLLSQYVQGHKKPSDKQAEKILSGIHQIGYELSGINLLRQT